jgi:hypothetical protein
MTSDLEPMTTTQPADTLHVVGLRLRHVAATRIEELLAEIPATMRRLRTFLLVLTVSIPLFLLVLAVVLWRLIA